MFKNEKGQAVAPKTITMKKKILKIKGTLVFIGWVGEEP